MGETRRPRRGIQRSAIEWTGPKLGQFRALIRALEGRQLGAFRRAAALAGLTLDEYITLLEIGQKRCSACGTWLFREEFGRDASRWDGLNPKCLGCQRGLSRGRYQPVPVAQRGPPGPPPAAPRDGDKVQARHRVNLDVKSGRRPNPNDLPCSACGHTGRDRRHEYHHHLGYAARHHGDVIPLCSACHSEADNPESGRTRCARGHEFTAANTIVRRNGTRNCRGCARARDRIRRPRRVEGAVNG